MPPFMGPFTIKEITSPVNVKLEFPKNIRVHNVIHVSKIKPFHETYRFGDRGKPPPFDLIDGEPEFEVEALLARKIVNGRKKYLVKWKGMDHCEKYVDE
jgi:hypothetical protein